MVDLKRFSLFMGAVLIIGLFIPMMYNISTTAMFTGNDATAPDTGSWYVNTTGNVIVQEQIAHNGSLVINATSSLELVNTTLQLNGNLTVRGSLRLFNSTLLFNGSHPGEYGVHTFNGSALAVEDLDGSPDTTADASCVSPGYLDNSSIVLTDSNFTMNIAPGTNLSMQRSLLRDCGLVVESTDVLFQDNTIVGCGVQFSPDAAPASIEIARSTFEHSSLTVADVNGNLSFDIHNDRFIDGTAVVIRGDIVPGPGLKAFRNNEFVNASTCLSIEGAAMVNLTGDSFSGSVRGIVEHSPFMPSVMLSLDAVSFHDMVDGILVNNSHLLLLECAFDTISGNDLIIENGTSVMSVNSTFNSSAVAIDPDGCVLEVSWYIDIGVQWSNGVPVAGANITVTNTTGSVYLDDNVDGVGIYHKLEIPRYVMTRPGSMVDMGSTLNITAKKSSYSSSVFPTIDSYSFQKVDLNDTDGPGGSVTINNGSALTSSRTVFLKLEAYEIVEGSGVSSISVSNTPVFEDWITPTPQMFWVLGEGDGTKTVNYRVMDVSGTLSKIFSSDIVLDTTPASSSLSVLSRYVYTRDVSVQWGPANASTDISSYTIEYSLDGSFWYQWITDTSNISGIWHGEEGQSVSFRCISTDMAGNVERKLDADAVVTIDSTPPVSTMGVLDPYSTSLSVELNWSGSDAASGIDTFTVQYSLDGGNWSLVTTTAGTNTTFTADPGDIPAAGQSYYFRVLARDMADNTESKENYDTMVVIDPNPPGLSVMSDSMDISFDSITFHLITAEPTSILVRYREDGSGWMEKVTGDYATIHELTLLSLIPMTTYTFAFTAYDRAQNQAKVTTFADTHEPISVTTSGQYGTIYGTVSLPGGTLADGARVTAISSSTGAIYERTTSENGSFIIDRLSTSEYSIDASFPGYFLATPELVALTAGSSARVDLVLSRISPGTGTLRVMVVDEDGAAVPAATIMLFHTGTLLSNRTTLTDSTGLVSIVLDPGTYDVSVSAVGFQSSGNVTSVVLAGNDTIVNIVLRARITQEGPALSYVILGIILALIVAVGAVIGLMLFMSYRKEKSFDRTVEDEDEDEEEETTVIQCPECGTVLEEGTTICPECGEELYEVLDESDEENREPAEEYEDEGYVLECPYCGEELEPTDDRCPECGEPIPEELRNAARKSAGNEEGNSEEGNSEEGNGEDTDSEEGNSEDADSEEGNSEE